MSHCYEKPEAAVPENRHSMLQKGMKVAAPRSFYFFVFAISGFSGLIYESIWTHYLKLFLGHAAYAQSLVLVIFMGGMALGSWLASRFSTRRKSPLLVYAGIELIVGVLALLFHDVFTALIEVFYTSILPSIGSPLAGVVLKWLAASILIVPQSILLGMTFPMMSAGIIRRFPKTPGGSLAMLYFTNSIGAAIGVLVSGFWLINLVGLPGTILTAGLLNIALALIVFLLVRLDPSRSQVPIQSHNAVAKSSSLKQLFLLAAFVTGAASFIYEISWIRMLSLVLGATTHSFELMLSAFITGLAFGGLWIKRRIDRIESPVRFSGYVQLVMGVLALLTIPVYVNSFEWMSWLIQALDNSDEAYVGYSIVSHVIALGVMVPTTFMAGMTLPLFTYVLIRQGYGESSIGQVYSVNTAGAIVGVLFAVHFGLPVLGLKSLIVVGAMLDIGLGIFLLSREPTARRRSADLTAGALVGFGAIVLTMGFANINPKLLVSGVYRYGDTGLQMESKIIFYQDGKTASIALRAMPNGFVTLTTNGKPDAAIQFKPDEPSSPDEITMVLLGTLPLAYMPEARNVANIGMGSGLTTHSLLAHSGIEKVDTVEIEPAIVTAASGFGEHVERVFTDSRSHVHIEDAKTFFSLNNSTYDMIIAEPSNPWVSGVSSLFSTEFYQTIRRHLSADGLFVQWVQLYEFNDDLAASILKALSANFSDYVIYATDDSNVVIIARNEGALPDPDWSILLNGSMAETLATVDIKSASDLLARKLIESGSLEPYLRQSSAPINSDYFPYVDLNAGKARFSGDKANFLVLLPVAPLPVVEMLAGDILDHSELGSAAYFMRIINSEVARSLHGRLVDNEWAADKRSVHTSPNLELLADLMRLSQDTCAFDGDPTRWLTVTHKIMEVTLPFLNEEQGIEIVDAATATECRVQQEAAIAVWLDVYRAVALRDAAQLSVAARRVLEQEGRLSGNLMTYVVSAAMLGDIAAGDPEAASLIWDRYGQSVISNGGLPIYTGLISSIALESTPL
jgi:predicted membrane-bound spermidine synthase